MKSNIWKILASLSPEAIIWISGLIILAAINIDNSSHFTICPFRNLGIDFCPGCGLGKSVHYLLHFKIEQSLNAHPLGIFAFAVLVRRIYELTKSSYLNIKIQFTNQEKLYDQSFTINA